MAVETVNFRGWTQSYRLANGQAEAIVVPQVGRVMSYRTAGGDNVLWVNQELAPDSRVRSGRRSTMGGWPNYGGYKLWPAPQSAWNWPPDPALDAGIERAEALPDGTLRLTGKASEALGIRFDRELRLAEEGTELEVRQVMVNTGRQPVTWAIWDVTQVRSDCVGFVPIGRGAQWRTLQGGPLDEQWRRVGQFLLVRPSGKSGKVFVDGPPPWLGCKVGDVLYIKSVEALAGAPPEPETPREVYTHTQHYVELEVVGPAVTLQPGQTACLTERWHLVPAGPEADSDEGLVRALRRAAEALGLPWPD